MNPLSNRQPNSYNNESEGNNLLWEYVQSLNPEAIAQLSKPSATAAKIMERNLHAMLGVLPPEHFDVAITTSREDLGRLLASAMTSGYFLHKAEQRMALEQSMQVGAIDSTDE